MASAVEVIEGMGFEADYFVSNFWSSSHINDWNRELAARLGLMLEEVRPEVVVFDGTWPFDGLLAACDRHQGVRTVWSNRGLHKDDAPEVPVDEAEFAIVERFGEIREVYEEPGLKVKAPFIDSVHRMEKRLLRVDNAHYGTSSRQESSERAEFNPPRTPDLPLNRPLMPNVR
jgi:hypothetical protein